MLNTTQTNQHSELNSYPTDPEKKQKMDSYNNRLSTMLSNSLQKGLTSIHKYLTKEE